MHYAPYGYLKDPENRHHLVIDTVTAPIVRTIYEWRANGEAITRIQRKLNEMGIPSPGRYRYESGIITSNNKKGSELLWNTTVLTHLLKNPVYLGHFVYNKTQKILYKGIPNHLTPREEWKIVKNTHEPILDTALFEVVQTVNQIIAEKHKANHGKYSYLPKQDNLYGKTLVCGDCGRTMLFYRDVNIKNNKVVYRYCCPKYSIHGALGCKRKIIRKDDLDAIIFKSIKNQIQMFLDAQNLINELSKKELPLTQSQVYKKEVKQLTWEIKNKRSFSLNLYEDYHNGIISDEEYKYLKKISD